EVRVADLVDLSRLDAPRRLLHTEHEMRARQDRLERRADASLEAARGSALVIEVHERFDVGVPCFATVRAGREAAHDALGAWALFLGRGGSAAEHPATRGRVRHPGHAERAENRHALQMLLRADAVPDPDLAVGHGMLDRADEVVQLPLEL